MKRYFLTYSKKELNGIVVLLFVLVLIYALPYGVNYFSSPPVYEMEHFKKEVAAFIASEKPLKYTTKDHPTKLELREIKKSLFVFDPNNLPEETWLRLGLSIRQIKVVKNYESKGGRFYGKEDLKKIYSISPEQYSELAPYIKIVSIVGRQYQAPRQWISKGQEPKIKPQFEVVELNSADSATLDGIRGIGPAFASRILRFRLRLGGFYSKEQLREVYGIDSLKYKELEGLVSVDRSLIKKIEINIAGFDDFKNHPYLTYKQVNGILNYRKQHGRYSGIGDLEKVVLLNEKNIRKIGPYLLFDP